MQKKPVLGIDIGSYNIKIAECVYSNGKMEILNYAVGRTPENAISDGKIADEGKIIEAIKELLSKNFIKTKNVIGLVSSSTVVTREITIPIMKEHEIQKYIQIDSQQYFPMDLSEYVLDYKILEELKDDTSHEYMLLLTAVPEAIINSYVKIFDTLKLELVAIDIWPNVAAKYVKKYLQEKPDSNNSTVAVLDLGAHSTSISIVTNGVLQFNRVIPNGSQELTNAIAGAFKLEREEAEEYKLKNAEVSVETHMKDDSNFTISEVCKPVLENITSYVNKFFEFYLSRGKANKINSIYLIGGGSMLKGLDEYYRAVFNVPTRRIHPADGIVDRTNKITEGYLAILLNAFATTYRED